MLKALDATLADLSLARSDAKLRYYLVFSRGDTVSGRVFLNGGAFFQFKASEFLDLNNEYEACYRAWKLYGDLTAQPFGHHASQGWSIIVMEGVHHKPVRLDREILRRRESNAIAAGLHRYFRIGGLEKPAPASDESHNDFLDRVLHHFERTRHHQMASHWIQHGRAMGVDTLPRVVQHGDFVQNNLASSGNKLVIFDWEDFGKQFLPGLDICSLCFSVAPDAATMRTIMSTEGRSTEPLISLAQSACTLQGLDWQFFRRLIPFYLVLFLYSKREYAPQAQDRIAALVRELGC